LDKGTLVICDRYVHSSLAYQGIARGLGEEFVTTINSYALKNFTPDLTLFLDISPQAAFERKHGADKDDRIEQLGLEFHQKVYDGYLKLAESYPYISKVDCSGTKYETSQKIFDILKDKGII
jgi:dTMP kinase